MDDNIKLVPDRWSHTGWKYVGEEPSDKKFFKSPNRINMFGRIKAPVADLSPKRGSNSVMRGYEKPHK